MVAYINYFFLFSFQPEKRSLKINLLKIIMMLSYKSIDWSGVTVLGKGQFVNAAAVF